MVAALGAGKFYGSSLPRPRFYTDVKLNGERIDPPLPVMDPLMAWAEEAHWSMGGVSTTRRRLQGRIEGNVSKLRETALFKKSGKRHKSVLFPSPAAIIRRRVIGLVDEEEEEEQRGKRREAASKSRNNSDEVAGKDEGGGVVVAARKRSKRKEAERAVAEVESSKAEEKSGEGWRKLRAAAVAGAAGIRGWRRLAKNGSST